MAGAGAIRAVEEGAVEIEDEEEGLGLGEAHRGLVGPV
jgi:hypothetical protein